MQPLPHLATLPVPLGRGVHSYDELPSGRRVFYALTSDGRLLNAELRRRRADETDASVVAEMWRDLERQDPVTARPHFALYVDGPFRPSRMRRGSGGSAGCRS